MGLERINLLLAGVGNEVAAMPSLHAGIACLVALYGVQRLRSPWRWLLLAYPLLMGLALVYDGEHYVVDVVCGYALAGAVLVVCSAWERARAQRPAPPGVSSS
ncbi:phosphatase PAP2 family protein [Nocardioides taihuensis]|uniref:Phosphatase PAP2 family protein n=1 Tax=Nocardioides taihuensis TaxID=1835606 RepID=A0ABW0BFC0_9ACTN